MIFPGIINVIMIVLKVLSELYKIGKYVLIQFLKIIILILMMIIFIKSAIIYV